MLHLVFPDTFEGIVSNPHKSSIASASAFASYVKEPTDDVDHRLAQIRSGLEAELGRDFDFYQPNVRNRWGSTTNPWAEFVTHARECIDAGILEGEEIQYKRKLGEDLANAREAVLAGAANWHNLLKDALKPTKPTWRRLGLSETKIGAFNRWCGDHPEESLEALQGFWVGNTLPVVERISAFLGKLPTSALQGAARARTNVISVLLMGLDAEQYPPFRDKFLKGAYTRTAYNQPERDADEARLYEHALGFLDRFIEEARQRELKIHHRLEAQTLVYAVLQERDCTDDQKETSDGDPSQTEPDIHSLADELTLPVCFLEEIDTLLEDKRQVIFQGPPGTGKTYVAQKLARHLARSEDRVTLVQFHPSYSYEDFVQGFRPELW